ncbi:AAA family ATPase [Loigolactobacillus backii]|uniref:AAA family ATPase n=1 Tax=Loigolactobacillus backii TaxID=375175 RepID=UPI0013043A8D|nr:AAA family ATPase [Loigolactobacillus backii]
MINSIDLSNYTYIFSDKEFTGLSNKNFIFGKNGTGKTSLVNAIIDEYSDMYDIRPFQGYDRFVKDNKQLNAISLGETNVVIQKEIETVNIAIKKLEAEIFPEESKKNFYSHLEKANKDLKNQKDVIDKFCIKSARTLKLDDRRLTDPKYNKNYFKNDIPNAQLLDDNEFKTAGDTFQTRKLNTGIKPNLPEIDLQIYLDVTNKILKQSVTPTIVIKELENNPDKQNFAKQGMSIHKRNAGEKCAFCGKPIDDQRWKDLDAYFSKSVDSLENKINSEIALINPAVKKLAQIKLLTPETFYPKFRNQAKDLNKSLNLAIVSMNYVLTTLLRALDKKKKQLFDRTSELEIELPDNLKVVQSGLNNLFEQNNIFNNNLAKEQRKAKNKLLYHLVQEQLNSFNYAEALGKLKQLKIQQKSIKEEFNLMENKYEAFKKKKKDLLKSSKDEAQAAEEINKYLKHLGHASFSLHLIKKSNELSGQYEIIGLDKKKRDISSLSTGERNIVAFLYFVYSLKDTNAIENTNKIIIFDDPMNSNDDSSQYLMITQIQQLCRGLKKTDSLILLTHNIHFYINVKYPFRYKSKKNDDHNRFFHFQTAGHQSFIKAISNSNMDIHTTYDDLWEELYFLYNANKPVMMLNPIRRIITTYIKFNAISANNFYKNIPEAKKYFDVNSHEIDDIEDFEGDPNGKTKGQIIWLMYQVFRANNGEGHFGHHTPDDIMNRLNKKVSEN